MGVHAVDAHDRSVRRDRPRLLPELPRASCRSTADDTTSMLFRMKDGMSGYLGTMTATGPGFSFQVFGSKGWRAARRRDACRRRLVGGAAHAAVRRLQVPAGQGRRRKSGRPRSSTSSRATLRSVRDARPRAAPPIPIPLEQMIHGAAVTEAIIRSAASREGRKGP